MGCGGSKEAVATGNTTAASASGKLLRRKSSVSSTGQSHTTSTSSSSANTGVAVKDVVKDDAAAGEVASAEKPLAGSAKAEDIVVMSVDKPVVEVEAKKEGVVVTDKEVAEDVASAPAAAMAIVPAATAPEPEQASKVVEEEELLPESTMADEAPVEEARAPKVDKAKEVAPLKDGEKEKRVEESKNVDEEHKATSPASTTNEDGGQKQNTTEPVEAKPVDEHKAEEKSTTDEQTAATAASEAPAN